MLHFVSARTHTTVMLVFARTWVIFTWMYRLNGFAMTSLKNWTHRSIACQRKRTNRWWWWSWDLVHLALLPSTNDQQICNYYYRVSFFPVWLACLLQIITDSSFFLQRMKNIISSERTYVSFVSRPILSLLIETNDEKNTPKRTWIEQELSVN